MPDSIAAESEVTIGICALTAFRTESPVSPAVQAVLDQMYILFTYNSGLAFTGTVLAVIGRYGIKKPEKDEK